MAYRLETTSWKFTVPQAGEVDSAENKANTLQEIDDALISPNNKAQLESAGQDRGGTTYDDYKKVYVTSLHEHPTPVSVPKADMADEATHAQLADRATRADRLSPGAKINGHLFDGTRDITIGESTTMSDIPGARRQFYGTVEPSQFGGFPSQLRDGDIYVKYFN